MFLNIFPLYGKIVILAGAKFNLLSLQSRLSAVVCDASFCSIKTKKRYQVVKKKKKQSYVGHRKDGRATGDQVLSYNQLKTRKLLGVRPAGFYLLFQDNLSTANVVLVFFPLSNKGIKNCTRKVLTFHKLSCKYAKWCNPA